MVDLIAFSLGTAQQGADAGREFVKVEWLDDIIVRPGIQTLHTVLDGVLGGQHQYGQAALKSQASANLQPIHSRQHPVQDDQVRVMVMRQVQAGATVGGNVHRIAFVCQAALQDFQNGRIILYNQDPLVHVAPLFKLYHKHLVEWSLCASPNASLIYW